MLGLATPRPWLAGIQAADLVCSSSGSIPIPDISPASQLYRPPQSGAIFDLATFICIVPESLHSAWEPWHLRELRLHPFTSCHIVGGAWKIPSEENYNTQHLTWKDIWKLQCSGDEPVYLGLKTLDLSFRVAGHTRWGDIGRFLSSTINEGLEVLRLKFPQNDNGTQHDMINRIWSDYISNACGLRELEFDNYIPSTYTALGDNGRVNRSIQKVVLSHDILPRRFTTLFTPEIMPNLAHLDLSGAYWHRRIILQEQQEWTKKWIDVKISVFQPPKAYATSLQSQ